MPQASHIYIHTLEKNNSKIKKNYSTLTIFLISILIITLTSLLNKN